jgi:hypothetical protein
MSTLYHSLPQLSLVCVCVLPNLRQCLACRNQQSSSVVFSISSSRQKLGAAFARLTCGVAWDWVLQLQVKNQTRPKFLQWWWFEPTVMSWSDIVFEVWRHVLHVWIGNCIVGACGLLWWCVGGVLVKAMLVSVGIDATKPSGVVSLYRGNIIVFPYPTPLLGLHQVQILPCRSKQAAAAGTITVSVLTRRHFGDFCVTVFTRTL